MTYIDLSKNIVINIQIVCIIIEKYSIETVLLSKTIRNCRTRGVDDFDFFF